MGRVENIVQKKEKILVTSISPFSTMFSKGSLKVVKKSGLCGKELIGNSTLNFQHTKFNMSEENTVCIANSKSVWKLGSCSAVVYACLTYNYANAKSSSRLQTLV